MKVGKRLLQKLQGKSKECVETIINGLYEEGYNLTPFKVTQKVRNSRIVKHYETCLDKNCKISVTFSIQGNELLAVIVNNRIFVTKEELPTANCEAELRDIIRYIKLIEAKAYKRGKLARPVAEKIAKSAVEDLDEETKKALEELKELEKQRDELKKELEKLQKQLQTDEMQTDGNDLEVMDDEEIENYLKQKYKENKNLEDNINYDKIFLDKMWIQKVKVKWHPPKGTFAKTTKPSETAKIVCKGHKGDLKKSVASVNYFFNRAGICKQGHKNYDSEWCKNKDKIIEELHKICKGDTK